MKKLSQRTNNIIITSVVCGVALSAGVGLGIYFGMGYLVPNVNYNYSAEALEDDIDALMKKYERSNGDISQFKPYELVNISTRKYADSQYHYSVVDGWVNASGIVQTIKGTSIKNDTDYFNESISASSLVKVARRFYQNDMDVVEVYHGTSIQNGASATWNESPNETLTSKEYEETWGKTLQRTSIYVVSSKTVLNSQLTTNDDGNYSVTVELDPVLSVIRYVKQMKSMSSLDRYPKFSEVNIEFEIDKNLTLLKTTVHEKYEVFKLGLHKSDSVIEEAFYYDQQIDIPDYKTNCTYGG